MKRTIKREKREELPIPEVYSFSPYRESSATVNRKRKELYKKHGGRAHRARIVSKPSAEVTVHYVFGADTDEEARKVFSRTAEFSKLSPETGNDVLSNLKRVKIDETKGVLLQSD